jgi:hypothetical protein
MADHKGGDHVEDVKNINAKLNNPLAGLTHAQLADQAEEYCRAHQIGDEEDIRAFRLGAVIAQVSSPTMLPPPLEVTPCRLAPWPLAIAMPH